MKILVFGGCGFIGSAFVRFLMERTPHIIVNVDKLTYASNSACLVYKENRSRYQFYQLDLIDFTAISQVINSEQPDCIINFAAETHVDRSIDGPNVFLNSNLIGTYNLLQAALGYWEKLPTHKQSDFRFHQVSTDEVYGELLSADAPPFTELSVINPSSPYSASKASADSYVHAWGKTYGLPILITRSSNNYGPWQYREKLIPVVVGSILKDEKIPIYGKGDQQRNWLHVDDHVRALYQVLTRGAAGEVFNIGSDDETSNLELVSRICVMTAELLGIDKEIPVSLISHVSDRKGHDFRYALSSEKVKEHLGWVPEIDFYDGLSNTVEWYVKHCAENFSVQL